MSEDKFTSLQKVALVILRVLIGWHFLYEGVAKLLKGNWSAAGYLSQSRGFLAPFFHWIVDTPTVLAVVNQMNIWGLIAIGLGLIVGCLTRWAAYAGMLLIALYYLANPPFVGFYYSIPMEGNYLIVNKNLVEMAALFVIAITPNGRWAGLDFLLHKLFCRKK
ncbi:MAG: DoxX family protein [candidate division KSB1 bacterium]|nr:DoxX family protein [candidate division KSB1 bacterium]